MKDFLRVSCKSGITVASPHAKRLHIGLVSRAVGGYVVADQSQAVAIMQFQPSITTDEFPPGKGPILALPFVTQQKTEAIRSKDGVLNRDAGL